MSRTKTNSGGIKGALHGAVREFFRQTFRRHSGAEYSELLTRGLRGSKGVNRKYPWAYIRLFTLVFVLLAVFVLIVRFTGNELFVPTITVLAAACFNLSFLLLLYELYPLKDLSFMSVCLAMLLGGALANLTAQILFSLFTPTNDWLLAVYTGFFEELTKMLATIIVIVVSRKTSPLAGFLLGAAVGCGYSVAEDMGYIFIQTKSMTVLNLSTLIDVSMARGATAVCTHTLWTAAIGWAYSHFSRHFANVFFYLITLLSCGLHIAWDLPLDNLVMGFIYAGCATVAAVEISLILHYERNKVFLAGNALRPIDLYKNEQAVGEEWERAQQESYAAESLNTRNPLFWRHWGHFVFVLGAFMMSVISIIFCSIPFRETYGTQSFYDPQEFIEFMQDGVKFKAENNRQYDENAASFSYGTEGKIRQEVVDGNIVYNYVYTVNVDSFSGKTYYFPAEVYAIVSTTEGSIPYFKEDVYDDGKLYASFFRVRQDVTGYYFEPNGEQITVILYNPAFERDLSDWKYLSLFVTFAAIFGAATITSVSLYIKSWRVKKCLTENASSVK